MFARVFALLPLALLASAATLQARDSQCNGGTINCCSQVLSQQDANYILSQNNLVGVAADAGALVGVTCSLNILGSTSCSQQQVCCTGNNFNGVVAVGCTPINVGL